MSAFAQKLTNQNNQSKTFSATSSYMVSEKPNKLRNDIETLLSDLKNNPADVSTHDVIKAIESLEGGRKGECGCNSKSVTQDGGAKRKGKKGSKTVKTSKTSNKSKKSKKSKKTSRSRNMKREDPLAKYREYVAYIQKDMDMKGGPLVNTFAAIFREEAKKSIPNGSQDELHDKAKEIYRNYKKNGKIDERLKQAQKKLDAGKEKRKAKKAKEKETSESS